MYSPDIDTKLYRTVDMEPLDSDKVNFDSLNKELIEARADQYDITKEKVEGAIVGAVGSANKIALKWYDEVSNWWNDIISKGTDKLLYYGFGALLILIFIKKI